MSSVFESHHDVVTITKMRETHLFLRLASLFTVVMFVGSITFPQFLYAKTAHEIKAEQIAFENENKTLTESLKDFRKLTRNKKKKVDEYLEEEGAYIYVEEVLSFFGFSQLTMEEVSGFLELRTRLKKHHEQNLKEYAKTREWIADKKLGEEIEKRHQDMIDEHNEEYQKLEGYFAMLFDSEDILEQSEALDKLNEFASQLKLERSHDFTDPNKMPWGVRDPSKARAPFSSKEEARKHFNKLQAQLEPNTFNKAQLLEKGVESLESVFVSKAHADEPETYLGETIEVQFTQDIIDKAAELNNDPVTIYNWVRNNVESTPTFGSIQGADMTLSTLKGNPFDIASLLVALLRVSGTPARFAMGTVTIDAPRAMNWVGDAGTPEAALSLLGQGGTPIRGVAKGGKIVDFELEHIWVEAYVDFEPSRAFHNETPDTWIPMDASFKQYDYTQGYNLETEVPFDAQGLIDEITASAIIDEEAGTIQNIDQAVIEAAFANYQSDIETYINNQDPDATVGEVLGTQKVIIKEPNQLASGLPYQILTRFDDYNDIPDSYRHKWQVEIQTKDRYGNGGTIIELTKNLVEINDKTLAIHFDPATDSDRLVIESLIPETDEEGEIDSNSLPEKLPAHLISLVTNISINGENLTYGSSMPIGEELIIKQGLFDPVFGWEHSDSSLIVGEYIALGVKGMQVNPKLLWRVQTDLERALVELESIKEQNETPAQTNFLSKHSLVGSMLQTTILSYLTMNNLLDNSGAKSNDNVINLGLPSFGTFSTKLSPAYTYGQTLSSANFSGMGMDVDRYVWATASNRNLASDIISFHKHFGSRLSAMEHIIPEEVFKDLVGVPPEGISTVKALSLAANSGQKIYTLTSKNSNEVQNINADQEVLIEISNAINQGKEVTIHESSISLGGWSGFGYMILDQTNGTGAYKISGGSNGSFVAIGYILEVFSIFYGLLSDLAKYSKVPNPIARKLETVSNFITLANIVHTLIKTGGQCLDGDVSPVLFVTSLFAIIAVGAADIVATLTNPLVGFATGVLIGAGTNWILEQAGNCKE